MKAHVSLSIAIVTALACLPFPAFARPFIQEPVALQVSTTVSDGAYSYDEIIARARAHGVRTVVLGERDLMRWEYGVWPLRALLRKKVEGGSLLAYGVRRYLAELELAQSRNPDMIIIPGVESAPYYYWTGNPFASNLKINDWHRHIMSFGFSRPEDYENIPVIGNRQGMASGLTVPMVLFLLGACGGVILSARKRSRLVGVAVTVACILLSLNDFYSYHKFNQYQGDLGVSPYKEYIRYCRDRGALTFWTHPEAKNIDSESGVAIETQKHSGLLPRVDDYTGFFIFHEGYDETGAPGGIWDGMLEDYCRGRRRSPVWAAGGMAVDKGGLDLAFEDLRVVCLVEKRGRKEVLDAISAGRMYVARGRGSASFVLDEFSAAAGGVQAFMGEELRDPGAPTVTITGHLLDGQAKAFQIKLIRSGKVIKFFDAIGPDFTVSYRDEAPWRGKGYYRAEISAAGVQAVTNPVFIAGGE